MVSSSSLSLTWSWVGTSYADASVLVLGRPLVSCLPADRFYEGHKCTVATSFMSPSLTLYHVPFPVCTCFPQFPSRQQRWRLLHGCADDCLTLGYCRQSPLVPHTASWVILSSGFGCLPVLLALCHLLSWCRCSLWVKFNVYKPLCSVFIYLLFPIFFMTPIFF